ncbi:hypothetical protein, partial [Salinivibrio kushneri]|uniref:hypothetical protein n=1 Tax=Salinivibrio kushneri TaxID=1908198 RepID=UPI001A7EC28E
VGEYIYRLQESLERIQVLSRGHGLLESIKSLYYDTKNLLVSTKLYQLFLFFLFSAFPVFFFRKYDWFLSAYVFLVILAFSLFLYSPFVLPYDAINKSYAAICFLVVFCCFLSFFMYERAKGCYQQYSDVFFISTFLLFLPIAVSFGTNNNIWTHADKNIVFAVAGLVSLSLILETRQKGFRGTKLAFSIITCSLVIFGAYKALKEPYRLNSSIDQQSEMVDILGGIKVDGEQKVYIQKLLQAKEFYNHDEKISLIDSTGLTPGANVILEARFFEQPWIFRGPSENDEFAYKVLNPVNSENLRNAWVLTTSNGRWSLNHDTLRRLNLPFPEGYEKVTSLRLTGRNEIQELWMPVGSMYQDSCSDH